MIIVDIIKNNQVSASLAALTFYRDTNQKEVDLILERGTIITPVEIKASETIQTSFFDTLVWFKEETKSNQTPVVVYGGNKDQYRSRGNVVSWKNCHILTKN